MNSTRNTIDSMFSALVAELILGQVGESVAENPSNSPPELPRTPTAQASATQAEYFTVSNDRRNIFRTIRDYTSVIENYNRNFGSLIQLLQNESANQVSTPEIQGIAESERRSNSEDLQSEFTTASPVEFPRTPSASSSATPAEYFTNSDELRSLEFPRIPSASRPEYFTVRRNTSPFSRNLTTTRGELNNITRLWGRPRHRVATPGLLSSQEYIYLLNLPTTISPGLTPEEIIQETIDTVYDSSNNRMSSQCPISFDDFQLGESVLQIRRCGHIFKPVELRRWLARRTGCPVCRCNLRPTPNDALPNDDEFATASPPQLLEELPTLTNDDALPNDDSRHNEYSDLPNLDDME